MGSTNFTSGTVISSVWLNDVDADVYRDRPYISIFSYLSDVELADVQAYTFSVDVTTKLQTAINTAWADGKELIFPPGGYLVTGLTLTALSAERGQILSMRGAGYGEIFYTANKGTIFRSTTDAPIFTVDAPATPSSAGTLMVQGFRFEGDSSTPVVHLEAFYGQCEFSHNQIIQNGVGNGLQIEYGATGLIRNCYAINGDAVTVPLYSARTGIGFYFVGNYDAGLMTFQKCTARGFHTGFKVGTGVAATYSYVTKIVDCETSTTYRGIHLTANARGCLVKDNFLEGGEEGAGILDAGDYNTVQGNYLFAGHSPGISSVEGTYGNKIVGNVILAASVANSVLIDVTSSAVGGGPGKTVRDNHLSFGGSGGAIPGVVGLRINGTDPRIDISGNSFFPRDTWVGGAGTMKINNLSGSGDATVGHSVYGLQVVSDKSGDRELPFMGHGAINLHVDTTALVAADISAGVLTLGDASIFTLDLAAPTNITSIVANNLPDKTFELHVVDNNPTFVNGALLKCKAGANYTPPAGGAWLKFQVKPGGVIWMTGWTEY